MDKQLPKHVAIIMDGNGRWANQRGKNRTFGHRRGSEVARQIIQASVEANIPTLTLFAFSTENRRRPRFEIVELTELFASSLRKEADELLKSGVKLSFWGDMSFFESNLRQAMEEAELKTVERKRLQLNVAVNYSGRWDIANATAKALAEGALRVGFKADAIERLLPDYLGIEEVDLLIRTGGEHRLSNFLLWQSAYAELYFTDTLWPDFSKEKYTAALEWYAGRERRFGLTSAQLQRSTSRGEG